MKRPQMPLEGGSVRETVEQVIRCLPREKTRNRSPRQPAIDFPEDTIPPFWPVLNSPDAGSTYTFTLSDGYVFERTADPWLPAGLSTAGLREQIAITASLPQISIVVATDPDGVVTGVSYAVEAEDTASIEPDGKTVYGEIRYKLAVFHAAVSQYPAYLEMIMAGSHIFYDRRGGNLDQHVFVVDISGGVIQAVSDHYLCWRAGHYVGKFASGDTRPGSAGALDTSSVTHLSGFYP